MDLLRHRENDEWGFGVLQNKILEIMLYIDFGGNLFYEAFGSHQSRIRSKENHHCDAGLPPA